MNGGTVELDGFTVSSNSETSEEMSAALAPPVAEAPAPVAATEAESPTPAADAKPTAKPRNDPQARVEQATAKEATAKREAADARREAAELRQRLEALERRPPAEQKPPPATEKPTQADWQRYKALPDAPQIADFEDYTDYNAALSVFVADQRYSDRRQAEAVQGHQQRVQQSETEHFTTFQGKLQAAVADDPDFLTKIDSRLTETPRLSALPAGSRPTFGNYLVEQIYRSEAPKELLVHFTAHPEDVQRLAALPPNAVVREIARLEARLTPPAASPATGTAAAPAKSKANPPIQPVKGSSQVATDEPPGDDASDEAHDAYWSKQRKRFRA